MPTWGNSLQRSMMRSVKNPLVEMTIRSLFLYSSRTISFISVRIKGSPPVIFVKYIGGNLAIVSSVISSSGFDGALYLLHIEQRALHLYVTITVPFSFFSLIYKFVYYFIIFQYFSCFPYSTKAAARHKHRQNNVLLLFEKSVHSQNEH